MLTSQHLTILRAALQFFDEELSPHGADAISDYVAGVTPDDVATVRRLFENAEVIACDTGARTVTFKFPERD